MDKINNNIFMSMDKIHHKCNKKAICGKRNNGKCKNQKRYILKTMKSFLIKSQIMI